jgi:flagellar protein FliJ
MAKFRLQTVLNLRKHREDDRKRELAGVLAAEQQRKAAVQRLADLRQKMSVIYRQIQGDGEVDIQSVIEQKRYLGFLDREVVLQLREVRRCEQVTAEYRQRLMLAMRDRKSLDVLKNRAMERARLAENRAEAADLDEVGLRIHQAALAEELEG